MFPDAAPALVICRVFQPKAHRRAEATAFQMEKLFTAFTT